MFAFSLLHKNRIYNLARDFLSTGYTLARVQVKQANKALEWPCWTAYNGLQSAIRYNSSSVIESV